MAVNCEENAAYHKTATRSARGRAANLDRHRSRQGSSALQVAGVDMLRSSRGPLVLEVNASPGREGIEQASGVDIDSEITAFLERHMGSDVVKKRSEG